MELGAEPTAQGRAEAFSEAESLCKEALLKLEAICESGGREGGTLLELEELVSDKEEEKPTLTGINSLKEEGGPDGRGPELGMSSPVQTYQIPLVDRSFNQSLSYPPPPPPSPGLTLKITPPGSPAVGVGQVEAPFILPSPGACPPATTAPQATEKHSPANAAKEIAPCKESQENLSPSDDTKESVPCGEPQENAAKEIAPSKDSSSPNDAAKDIVPCGESKEKPSPSDGANETGSSGKSTEATTDSAVKPDGVSSTEDAASVPPAPPPAATAAAVPEGVPQQPLPQYPQVQQPVAAAATSQPIIVTQQTTDSNSQQQQQSMMGGHEWLPWMLHQEDEPKNPIFLILSIFLLVISILDPLVFLCALPAFICAVISLVDQKSRDNAHAHEMARTHQMACAHGMNMTTMMMMMMMRKDDNGNAKAMNMFSLFCSILGYASFFFLTTVIILFVLFLIAVGQLVL